MCIYLDILCGVQANSIISTGRVRLDLNLLKPSRIEFLHDPERARRERILSNVVGVRVPDGPPGPALDAHKAGRVDWGEPAG